MSAPVAARVLVLGSNSFSGASFVEHLLRAGVEVIGASRSADSLVPIPIADLVQLATQVQARQVEAARAPATTAPSTNLRSATAPSSAAC